MAVKLDELHKLRDAYVICRARRHRWDPIPDQGGRGRGRKFEESKSVARISSRCERCGTIREEAWNKITGAILFVSYIYPKDYQLPGAGVKPWNVRKEYLNRNMNGKRSKK